MSNRAVCYLRSSKDISDVSPDTQRRALHQLAADRRLVVVDEYLDAVESGKDEDRPAFQRLVRAVKDPARGWEHILLLDTSRLARRRLIAMIFERECERARVVVIYKNIPETDPATEMLLKSMLQAFDEWHSLTSKAKGLAGMAENVRQGWRAGGRAPRGYRLEYTATGAIREGEPVTKSRLVIDDDVAPQVARYLKLRAAGMPRGRVIDQLQLQWPATSTHSMDWQALTYAGHTVWNVHNEREQGKSVNGEKRRPRTEWMIQRGTHEAMISDAEAESILSEMERATQGRRVRDTPMLLSGLVRAPDGTGWHSDGCGYYRLGKGPKVGAERLERAVLDQVAADMQSDTAVDALIHALTDADDEPASPRMIAAAQKRLAGMTTKIGRAVDLASSVDDPTPILRHVADLEATRLVLLEQIEAMRRRLEARRTVSTITADDVRALLRRLFAEVVDAGDRPVHEARRALAELIESVELDPVTMACQIRYAVSAADSTGDKMASRSRVEQTPAVFTGATFEIARFRRSRAA